MVCGCGATGAALSCTGVDAEPQPPATISAVAHTQANNTRVSVIRAFHPPCARTWRCAGSCARAGPDPSHREAVPGSRAAHQESCRQSSGPFIQQGVERGDYLEVAPELVLVRLIEKPFQIVV